MQGVKRQRGIRLTLAPQLEIGNQQAVTAVGRQSGHCKPMIDRCPWLDVAMRRHARRHQNDAIEREPDARGSRRFEVAEMNGIEGATENADTGGC